MTRINTDNITRRDLLKLGAAATAAVHAGTAYGGEIPMPAKPNVLIIHCHDLGTYLKCYGAKTVQSPHLDAFAAEGVRFARSYCSAPQCSPSRASIFTGRYPHNNGVMGLCHAGFAWDLHPEERHMGQILRDAGYATSAVGIIHETHSGPKRCGYDEHTGPAQTSKAVDKALGKLKTLSQDTSKPFFMSVGFIEPHRLNTKKSQDFMGFVNDEFGADTTLGVDVPPYLRDTEGTRQELAELQGAVHHVDTHVGRLLEGVREYGLDENTLVIFTTDHGYAMPRAKCSLYDPGLGVAFMLRLPSREGWHGGGVKEEMISNVDYLPTILDLLGIETPDNVQGRSFAPLLDGGTYAPRDAIYGELSHHDYYDPKRCIRTKTHKLVVNFSSAPFFMDPSQSWRPRSDTTVPPNPSVAYHEPVELYDLVADPWEQKNLAEDAAHADTRQDLLARLYAHLRDTDDPILQGAITPPMHLRAQKMLEEAGK
jgi:N-sulfoglucosamine sulfohydrolase